MPVSGRTPFAVEWMISRSASTQLAGTKIPRLVGIHHDDYGYGAKLGKEVRKFRPNTLVRDLSGAKNYEDRRRLRFPGNVLDFVKRSHRTNAQSGIVFYKAARKAFTLKCSLVDNHDQAFAWTSFVKIGPAKTIRVRQMSIVYRSCCVVPKIGNLGMSHRLTYSSPSLPLGLSSSQSWSEA
jgi:hypothetical protein